jgi:ribokinase
MPTFLAGAVGQDTFADAALQCLRDSGVDLSATQRLEGRTGLASIAVDAQAENQILVAPGVNLALRHEQVPDALLRQCQVLLLQMEVDPAQNFELIERAHRLGISIVLNNSPARELPVEVLRLVDVLIVNQHELELSARGVGIMPGGGMDLLCELADRYALTVLLTQGAQGVVARAAGGTWQRPAYSVQAVDTTRAGDTFAGVFAAARAEQRGLHEALSRATVAAALACTRHGAQHAQPSRDSIERALPLYLAQLGSAT